MLLPRILTAIVGIPLILGAIYIGSVPFLVLVWGISLLALYEVFGIFKKMGHAVHSVFGLFLASALYLVFIAPGSVEPQYLLPLKSPPLLGLALTLVIVILSLWELFHIKSRSMVRTGLTVFAILFTVWPIAHLVLLRDLAPLGKIWCYFLMTIIWTTDSFAYISGMLLGGKKLAPKISPKKTIVGFLGGLVGGFAASALWWYFSFRQENFSFQEIVILGTVLAGVFGQLSDLVESMLKREAQIKDSANILPGHGGILDRFDSFIFTAPLLYYYLAFR